MMLEFPVAHTAADYDEAKLAFVMEQNSNTFI